MFSGPRNISTTMMRAFENRADTVVFDEPFYACYLAASGADHPMREAILASQPNAWDGVVEALAAPLPAGATVAFEKHIAFHFVAGAPLDWIDERRVLHLIRDPRAMIASYRAKYDDVAPILDSLRFQRALHERRPSPIVDAADVLRDPPGILRALCGRLGIPFHGTMLSWPAGPRASDGVWAPHWYDAVLSSTGFRPYVERAIELAPELEALAARCADDYRYLYDRRLTV